MTRKKIDKKVDKSYLAAKRKNTQGEKNTSKSNFDTDFSDFFLSLLISYFATLSVYGAGAVKTKFQICIVAPDLFFENPLKYFFSAAIFYEYFVRHVLEKSVYCRHLLVEILHSAPYKNLTKNNAIQIL